LGRHRPMHCRVVERAAAETTTGFKRKHDKLGFECLGTWQDPPVYAIVARDQQAIHFRCAEPPTANPDKYRDELLDAYVRRRCRRTLCRVRRPRLRIHSGACQHAMALARVRGERLRWPSAGFRREPVVFFCRPFQKTDLGGEWLGNRLYGKSAPGFAAGITQITSPSISNVVVCTGGSSSWPTRSRPLDLGGKRHRTPRWLARDVRADQKKLATEPTETGKPNQTKTRQDKRCGFGNRSARLKRSYRSCATVNNTCVPCCKTCCIRTDDQNVR
jgi:hypothetical protein